MARKKNTLSDSAQAMTEGLFGSPEKQDAKEAKTVTVTREAPEADTAIAKKTAQNGKGKTVKATYGARISAETTIQWKAYIEASGADAGVCTEQALREYMERHRLTGIQKQIYDLKMQALNK